jgi:hypothetical protein
LTSAIDPAEARDYLTDHLDLEAEEPPDAEDWHCDLEDHLRALDRNHPVCGRLAVVLEPFSNDDDRINCTMYPLGGAVIFLEEQSPGGSFDACLVPASCALRWYLWVILDSWSST